MQAGGAPAAADHAQASYVYIKRAGDAAADGEVYAELAVLPGDTVARLAGRAVAAFPRWGAADAGQLRLHLVERPPDADEPPSADEEALAVELKRPHWTLARAGVGAGSWLLARVAPPAAAAAPAGALRGARAGSPSPLALVCAYSRRRQRARSPLPFSCAQAALGRRWEQVGSASSRRSRL